MVFDPKSMISIIYDAFHQRIWMEILNTWQYIALLGDMPIKSTGNYFVMFYTKH